MSNKGEPPGAASAPPLQNLLLYVSQPAPSQTAPSPQQQQHRQQQQQPLTDQQIQELNQIRHVPPPRLVSVEIASGVTDKSIKDEHKDVAQHIHYQMQTDLGGLQKDALSIGDAKNVINSFQIGVQNVSAGQRLVSSDKLPNGAQFNPANFCAGGFLELNHHQQDSNTSGNVLTLTRSESVRSETGESCSSMSSGDGVSNECAGNIIILPGQIPSNLHGQQIIGQNHQIVIGPNPTILNGHANNIVIAGGSDADQTAGTAYQILEHNIVQQQQQQQMINSGINIVNHQIVANGRMNGRNDGQQEGLPERAPEVSPVSVEGIRIPATGLPVGMEEIVLVNNVPHQLIRTPAGIVLGVKPSAVGSAGVGLGVVNGVHNVANNVQQQQFVLNDNKQVLQQQLHAQQPPKQSKQYVTIPYRWNRVINGNSVVYISPSGTSLSSLDQVREYLQAAGTCKCGLDCPLQPELAFNFDSKVIGRPYDLRSYRNDANKTCTSKRKLIASISSTISNKQILAQQQQQQQLQDKDKDSPAAKKRKRRGNPYSNVSVSQLLAQREIIQHQEQQARNSPTLQNQQQSQIQQQNQQTIFKDNVWQSSVQMCNANNPQPMHPQSASILQAKCNSINHVQNSNNFSNGNTSIPLQVNQFIKTENNGCIPNEFQGKLPPGSQIFTINGNTDSQQKLFPHQIILNGPPNNNFQRTPILQNRQNIGHMPEINHIIGPNGQIIGIQTNVYRNQNSDNVDKSNIKCNNALFTIKSEQFPIIKEDDKRFCNDNSKNTIHLASPNVQFVSSNIIIPSSIQSGTNINSLQQPNQCNADMTNNMQNLTPEVIQRINQQQQIFIQQNQKQMELAKKGLKLQNSVGNPQQNIGIRTTIPINDGSTDHVLTHQGTLIVTNNPLTSSNHTKMPPWQLNRINSNKIHSPSYSNEQIFVTEKIIPNQNEGSEKCSDNSANMITNTAILENLNMVITQNSENQNIFSRVPPLHQHSPQPIWSDELQKRKAKSGKLSKKTRPYNTDNQRICHINMIGQTNSSENKNNQSLAMGECFSNTSTPSFMDDPSGYLAQQTALLNSTISRRVEFNNMLCSKNMDTSCNYKGTNDNIYPPVSQKTHISSNSSNISIEKTHDENFINHKKSDKNISNNVPDSSNNIEKINTSQQSLTMPCQLCLEKCPNSQCNHQQLYDQQLRHTNIQRKVQNYIQSISSKSMVLSQPGTPSPSQNNEDNPVTSSTLIERPGSNSNMSNDLRGPIQGGIISTSNGSPMESLTLPEFSPTPSNSSRSTDTPQSKNSGNMSSSCSYTISSPIYSNQSSSHESNSSNPATPSPGQNQNYIPYNSPGPTMNQTSNLQAFNNQISNSDILNTFHLQNNDGVQRNIVPNSNMPSNVLLNEDGSIHSDSSRVVMNQQKRSTSSGVSGYYLPAQVNPGTLNINPDNHMMFVQSNGIVTTMASGHTLSRNTITSVLAGKAQTATTSINASPSTLPFTYPVSNVETNNMSTSNKNIQFENIQVPPDYPVHIAGSLPQNIIAKSPLEMVQNVVSNIQVSQPQNCANISLIPQQHPSFQNKNSLTTQVVNSGQIVVPQNGQFIVANGNQTSVMAPPPPKSQSTPTLSSSSLMSTVTTTPSQSIPSVGGVQQVINSPTVLVNALSTPFVLQPQVMTVDGQVVNQNVQMSQIVPGNIISQRIISDNSSHHDNDRSTILSKSNLLSPDSAKRKNKKKKIQNQSVTPVLQITAQHSPGGLLVHNSQQQPQQFSPQGFQVSPNSNMSGTPMLQALTIVPGKPGTPAHIVMNGQSGNANFGSQQIIANSPQGPQHINLLQPVNLLNGTGVVQNFPTFQQFIVPGIGSMVMTSDGTAILQDTSSMPMQLQIQNVNGQNVLTPVQNQGIISAGPTGMVIRTQTPNNKIIQSQHSPGAQFLSPTGGQIVMSGSPFNGQLSPLVANVSPNQSVTFNTSPQQVRSNVQQDYIQCNQMGQTLMVPVSPNQIAITSSPSQQNTPQQNATFVQQNTTIVQQQTTMVSNNHTNNHFQNTTSNTNNTIVPSLNIDQGIVMNQGKQNTLMKSRHNIMQFQNQAGGQIQNQQIAIQNPNEAHNVKRITVQYPQIVNQLPQQNNVKNESQPQLLANINSNVLQQQIQNHLHPNVRHSVSTQTFVNQQTSDNKSPMNNYNQQISGSSPPDTTTHSPLGALDSSTGSPANSLSGRSSNSSQGNQVDTTTASPEPNEPGSLPMVHCISSSEPDSIDRDNHLWARHQTDNMSDVQGNAANLHHMLHPDQNRYFSTDSSLARFNTRTMPASYINNTHNSSFPLANHYQKNFGKFNNQNYGISQNHAYHQHTLEKVTPKINHMASNLGLSMQNYHKQIISNNDNYERLRNEEQFLRECIDFEEFNTDHCFKRDSLSRANETTNEESTTPSNPDEVDEKSLVKGFKEGDLVWGPVKGYPAWPGKLISKNVDGFNNGKVLVRWFGGDKSLSTVDPVKLQTLSEGLEVHHAARTKCRKSRKLNAQLEKAIQEAMHELDRITENKSNNADELNNTDINCNSNKVDKIISNKFVNSFEDERNKMLIKQDTSMNNINKSNRSGSLKVTSNHGTINEIPGRLRSSNR